MGRGEKMIKINVLNLIKNYTKYFFNYNIYVQTDYVVNQEMMCLLVDDEIQENTIIFENVKYKYLVNIDVVYSTIDNLNQQKLNPSNEDYTNALKYYVENDAFIDLEQKL